jgi:hypothetical protein
MNAPIIPIPDTCRRLRNIKPGESFTYYKGDFVSDIGRSTAAPRYAEVLRKVKMTADSLESERIVILTQREVVIEATKLKPQARYAADKSKIAVDVKPPIVERTVASVLRWEAIRASCESATKARISCFPSGTMLIIALSVLCITGSF